MKRLVKSLIRRLTCTHNWDILKEITVYSEFGYEHTHCLCGCRRCGKLKKIKLK